MKDHLLEIKSLMAKMSLIDGDIKSYNILNESARDRKVKNMIKQTLPFIPDLYWNAIETYTAPNGEERQTRKIEIYENKLLETFNISTTRDPGGIDRRFELGLARIAYGELAMSTPYCNQDKLFNLKEIVQYISDNENKKYDDDLNGQSYHSLFSSYKEILSETIKTDNNTKKNEIEYPYTGGKGYTVVKINSFDEASKFEPYSCSSSKWCITCQPNYYNDYGLDTNNQAYFFLKNNYTDIPEKMGHDYPYDQYGTSMFSIIVTPEGNIKAATLRWNHKLGAPGDDADVTKLAEISGFDIMKIAKPKSGNPLEIIKKVENVLYDKNISSTEELEENLNKIVNTIVYFLSNSVLGISCSYEGFNAANLFLINERKLIGPWGNYIMGYNIEHRTVGIAFDDYCHLYNLDTLETIKVDACNVGYTETEQVLHDYYGNIKLINLETKEPETDFFYKEDIHWGNVCRYIVKGPNNKRHSIFTNKNTKEIIFEDDGDCMYRYYPTTKLIRPQTVFEEPINTAFINAENGNVFKLQITKYTYLTELENNNAFIFDSTLKHNFVVDEKTLSIIYSTNNLLWVISPEYLYEYDKTSPDNFNKIISVETFKELSPKEVISNFASETIEFSSLNLVRCRIGGPGTDLYYVITSKNGEPKSPILDYDNFKIYELSEKTQERILVRRINNKNSLYKLKFIMPGNYGSIFFNLGNLINNPLNV